MATDLVEVDAEEPQPEAIERAAAAIRRGRVVAIPTDALYSLVADPFNLRAVAGVFRAKGREIHRSLPLLVADAIAQGAQGFVGKEKPIGVVIEALELAHQGYLAVDPLLLQAALRPRVRDDDPPHALFH